MTTTDTSTIETAKAHHATASEAYQRAIAAGDFAAANKARSAIQHAEVALDIARAADRAARERERKEAAEQRARDLEIAKAELTAALDALDAHGAAVADAALALYKLSQGSGAPLAAADAAARRVIALGGEASEIDAWTWRAGVGLRFGKAITEATGLTQTAMHAQHDPLRAWW